MNIYEKLAAVQQELKAPKDKKNTFGGYNYRSAEGILEAVKPVLKKYGATITLTDEIVEVGGRIYVKATASFVNTEYEATSTITSTSMVVRGSGPVEVTAFAREADQKKGMDESQITGTASSYARKYALNGLLLIDDTNDADTDEYAKQTGAEKRTKQETAPEEDPEARISAGKKTEIEVLAKRSDTDLGKILTKPLADLTNKQADALITSLKRRIK